MKRLNLSLLTSAAVLAALSAGCQEEFDSKTIVDGYRVLGVQMDPPELKGDTDEVTVRVLDVNTAGSEYSWSFCAISAGAITAYECFDADDLGIDPAALGLPSDSLEFPLEGDGAEITFDFQAVRGALLAAFRAYVVDTCGPDNVTDTLLYRSEVQVFGANSYLKLTSGPPSGRVIDTVHQLIISDSEIPGNVAPTIDSLTLNGEAGDITAPAGSSVEMVITVPESARETYPDYDAIEIQQQCDLDCAAGQTAGCVTVPQQTERLTYTWFTTGGETDPPVTIWNDTTGNGDTSVLNLPAEPGEVDLYVTVRDDRGGIEIISRTITVTAP